MRFALFVHMERFPPGEPDAALWSQVVELCRIADEAGFETVWMGEHHGMDCAMAPNPFVALADLASKTRRVRLGAGTVVAPFWHPVRLAGEAALADVVTGGRLELGVARGAYSYEYERLAPGLDAAGAGAALREIVPALKGLWRGDYAHEGAHWRFPATTSAPKPLQRPHPPIWIAAREPESHAFAAAHGCNAQVTPLWRDDAEVEALMARFRAADAAHPPAEGGARRRIMLLRHTFVGATEAEVEAGARALSRFYCHFAAWFRNERPVSQAAIRPLSGAEMAAMPDFAPERMRANNVVGRPEEVVRRLRAYAALGFDQYALWIDSAMDFEAKRRSLRLFVEEVLPAFADGAA